MMNNEQLVEEFARQAHTLLQKGYPKLANKTEEEFLKLLEPLKKRVLKLDVSEKDIERGYLPFVIVVKSDVVPTEKAMSLAEKDGKSGVTKLYPHQPEDFNVIENTHIPSNPIYLLVDIDRGNDTINQPPAEAMKVIMERKRSPLTIDEGVAIITHHPDFLIKNHCFSLLASRHEGDKRVPAIWINANKNPNLGWCWEGNPHTWLGSASAANRF